MSNKHPSANPWKDLSSTNADALNAAEHSKGHQYVDLAHKADDIVEEVKEELHSIGSKISGMFAGAAAAVRGETVSDKAAKASKAASEGAKKAADLAKETTQKASSVASEYTEKAKDSVQRFGSRVRDGLDKAKSIARGATLRGTTLPLGIKLSPIATMLLGWSGFIGAQALFSLDPTKQKIMDLLGSPEKFKVAYTLTTAMAGGMLSRYFQREGQFISIHCHDPVSPIITGILKAGAVLGLSQALVNYAPSIQDLISGTVKWLEPPATVGVRRITRYPVLWAIATYGLAKGLDSGLVGPHLFYGLMPLYAWIAGYLTDQREGVTDQSTSALPFQAIGEGKQSLQDAVKEINWPAAIVTLLATARWWLK